MSWCQYDSDMFEGQRVTDFGGGLSWCGRFMRRCNLPFFMKPVTARTRMHPCVTYTYTADINNNIEMYWLIENLAGI